MGMDAELGKLKQEIYQLKKQLQEAQHGKSLSESRLQELGKTLSEKEDAYQELQKNADEMSTQIDEFQKEKVKAGEKLEKTKRKTKLLEDDLKKTQESLIRYKKMDRAAKLVSENNEVSQDLESPQQSPTGIQGVSK